MTEEALDDWLAAEVTDVEIGQRISDSLQLVQTYYDVTERWMCSKNCPCLNIDEELHRVTSEATLNLRGRTDKRSDFSRIFMYFYQRTGEKSIDYFPPSFQKCYNDWKLDWTSYSNRMPGRAPGRGSPYDWQEEA